MAGIFTTNDYTISKGILMFQPNGSTGFEDFGNVSELKIKEEIEKKEHYESRTDAAKRDDITGIRNKASGSFTLDSISKENMTKWFLGTSAESSQTAATGSTASITVGTLNSWQKVGSYEIDSLVVKDETDVTTYVPNTDYKVNNTTGMIQILSTGSISVGDVLHLTYNEASVSISTINAATTTDIRGIVLFSADPLRGNVMDIEGYATLTPSGEYSAIGEDYISVGFDLDFVGHADYEPGLFNVIKRGNV